MARLVVVLVAALLVIAVLAGAVTATREKHGAECAGLRMDPLAWHRAARRGDEWPSPRQRLAERIIDCRVLDGVTRRQVRMLIGSPELKFGRTDWAYVTGQDRTGDSTILEMLFDGRGRVASVEHNYP